ncbi:unnamed protein product [Moneuplotes crassus]|uniref:Uncharacterized protein n=1 Tax=Euplotes crassus TaxID=5936 RepID=A0AAD1UH83_EUPCR|nr:unnamed protein product [Moneuplotes crassus]
MEKKPIKFTSIFQYIPNENNKVSGRVGKSNIEEDYIKIKSLSPVQCIRNIRMKKKLFEQATELRRISKMKGSKFVKDERHMRILQKLMKDKAKLDIKKLIMSRNPIKLKNSDTNSAKRKNFSPVSRYNGFLSPLKLTEKLNQTNLNFTHFSPNANIHRGIYSPDSQLRKRPDSRFFSKRRKKEASKFKKKKANNTCFFENDTILDNF